MMFTLADNEKIGQYLVRCIEERFKSHREFCREYLRDVGEEAGKEQLQKMSNRLSQILQGKKEIQLYDLPVFCRLLEISCEDILSAGKSHTPSFAHLTNYIVAFSKDERVWEEYINGEDSPITSAAEFRKNGFEYAAEIENLKNSPILHADEYGKTVIDYALKAENYDLLKYLMDRKYIWFVGMEEKDYSVGFGAGTSIERAVLPHPENWNVLDAQLKMRDELRTHMVALAIQHGDLEMLAQLRAREIPTLYQTLPCFFTPVDCKQYYNSRLMDELAQADNKILEYFSEEFEITDRFGRMGKFSFPFLGELIERLLQAKNKFAEHMLKGAIQHNQYVYDKLSSLLEDTIQCYKQLPYSDITDSAVKIRFTEEILSFLHFCEDGSLISYYQRTFNPKAKASSLSSNIVRVNATSSDTVISRRITELNELYEAIHHITPNFEGGSEQ